MYYKEYVRARGAIVVFLVVAGILLALSLLISYASSGHVVLGSSHEQNAVVVKSVGGPDTIPWPALFGAAALAAAIMATVLGSTFAQENDGHLELAFTKPYSRAKYAATTIAIDMAAIVLTLFLGFAFILIPIFLLGFGHLLVPGPDVAINAVRFTLFPLAWYAIIIGFSAGLRGKAGIVQGLIWPVTLALVALREAPFNAMWHKIFLALNVINPLIYASYQDQSNDAKVMIVGASPENVVWSAAMLALLAAAGWIAATLQWRRVEA